MPNFKLSKDAHEEIKNEAKAQMEKYVAYALMGFPLSHGTIQRLTAPEAAIQMMQELEREHGVERLPKTGTVFAYFSREDMPGLHREMLLPISLNESVYTTALTTYSAHNESPEDWGVSKALRLREDVVDDAEREAVCAWANRVVRARRLHALVKATVNNLLANLTTTAEIQGGWPVLGTLATSHIWKQRFRNPVRSLKRYAPRATLIERYGKHMQAAEAVLMGAMMMEPIRPVDGVAVYVNKIERVEKRETDAF